MSIRWTTVGLVILAVACDLPRDSDGTLDRIRGGTMRVGFVVDTPWTTDSAGAVGGIESGIVRSLARELNSRVSWVRGNEHELLTALQDRELDLVIGGLNDRSPWSKQVAFTRPYYTDTVRIVAAPREQRHVLATSPGENAWLVRVEEMLINRPVEMPRELRQRPR
jgi:polar amino acid transport system substrate-binding protein